MTSKFEPYLDVAHRFRWVDNNTIRVVNTEGIERLVDLSNNFKEIEFNVIPIYSESWAQENHYFFDKPTIAREDVVARLKRKYQDYKAAYYLEKKRDPHALYKELFTVDYTIGDTEGRFVADLSFTFLHWKLME